MHNLKRYFDKAGLSVEIEDKPVFRFVRNNDIFQLGIFNRKEATRSKKKGEYFRLYQGAKDNTVQALDADPNFQQVLLMVQEPERVFYTSEWDRETKRTKQVRHITPAAKRKYLVGMDECHLFMSEVPTSGPVNKVKDAHRALKPKIISEIEAQKNKKKVLRQGEWFMTPVTPKEQEQINLNLDKVEQKVRIDRRGRGKPHVPDFILRLGEIEYIKGVIRHPDHFPRKLPEGWHRVHRNSEIRQTNQTFGNWID